MLLFHIPLYYNPKRIKHWIKKKTSADGSWIWSKTQVHCYHIDSRIEIIQNARTCTHCLNSGNRLPSVLAELSFKFLCKEISIIKLSY